MFHAVGGIRRAVAAAAAKQQYASYMLLTIDINAPIAAEYQGATSAAAASAYNSCGMNHNQLHSTAQLPHFAAHSLHHTSAGSCCQSVVAPVSSASAEALGQAVRYLLVAPANTHTCL
jgi:hypothetical protein